MVVRMRRNRSQTAKRRSHHGLSSARVSTDKTGNTHLRHRVDPETGLYRGRVVIDIVAQAKRAARRTKRKEADLRASGQVKEETKK
jgi:ribosomal protein L32